MSVGCVAKTAHLKVSGCQTIFYTPITPREIARMLDLHESSVKRSLGDLVANGVVKKRYETGKLIGYEIVEFFGETDHLARDAYA